ncbi:DUF6624 domain-containing protein [Caulobacter sp. NIBR1757]|uniref:DUF6624 domain-containing protein n=1 Tax=Caulobacter sp. NIBR1757 TaxID=3016000 RepID=UPI0022F13243|nr:DUF6624 domain-containing protein [Caulobacter sp. NIBR1757]WGM40868.1 hypothetical protein AMEJIAPC_03815 [Caulobacter sp. NIBR1757]
MLRIVVACLLLIAAPAVAADAVLSPQAQALIAPVKAALDAERARQAALPPPANDSEKLVRMGAMDQVGRRVLTGIDLTTLPPGEIAAARKAMWAPIQVADDENLAALLKMVPAEGWFLKSRYGDKAAGAAFHIIQHSDVAQWKRFVPVLEPLVVTGEVDGQSFGLMYDRLAINEGRPQRYGSQMTCEAGKWVPEKLEDPARVEEWRKAMGFPQTFAEYLEHWKTYPPCT